MSLKTIWVRWLCPQCDRYGDAPAWVVDSCPSEEWGLRYAVKKIHRAACRRDGNTGPNRCPGKNLQFHRIGVPA